MEKYLQLKKESGVSADYSTIDNEAILRNYGIEIPPEALDSSRSLREQPPGQDQGDNPTQELINTNINEIEHEQFIEAEESKHLLSDKSD